MSSGNWKTQLEYLFHPSSIAIIGASESSASFTNVAYTYLRRFGYEGHIIPINPKRDKVWNIECKKSIDEIKSPVDQVIIGVAARLVPEILENCGRKGIKSAIVLSSGFKEVGSQEGIALQKKLVEVAEKHQIRVCGPNCVGFAAIKYGTVCYSAPLPPKIPLGKVGYVSQSATMAANVLSAGVDSGIGFAYAISSGNEAVLDISDYIEFMLLDPDVTVVAAFAEGFKNRQRFFEVADIAANLEKPILVLKVGRSEKGRRAAASHTGTMAGSYEVYQEAFRQKGIIPVESNEEMIESIKIFAHRKKLNIGGVSIIAGSGGVCGYLSDRAEAAGLNIPDFEASTSGKIKEALPSFGTVDNPLDTTGQARTDLDIISKVCRAILEDKHFDILMMGMGLTRSVASPFIRPLIDRFLEAGREFPEKIVGFVSCNTEGLSQEIIDFINANKVPLLQGGSTGLRAIRNLVDYNKFLRKSEILEKADINSSPISLINKWRRIFSENPIDEKMAKECLENYGIGVPRGLSVQNLDEAKMAADEIGYPVVLKILSPQIMHKTEIGAVRLQISGLKDLEKAFAELQALALEKNFERKFLIEQMAQPGVEMIVGAKNDHFFGPIVMVGLGGIFAELHGDFCVHLCPVAAQDAREMVNKLTASKLLHGFRGKPKRDIDALVDLIVKVSRIMQDHSDIISEIDLNPVVVRDQGRGALALDALFVPKKKSVDEIGA